MSYDAAGSERVLREVRDTVREEIAHVASTNAKQGREMTEEDERALARSVARRELDARVREAQRRGEQPLSPEAEDQLIDRVIAAVFALAPGTEEWWGRTDITDAMVIGSDPVLLRRVDGGIERARPLADTDSELVDWIQERARRSARTEREFSDSAPLLVMDLLDGSRLAAGLLGDRPCVTIRRHPLVQITHDDLVARRMYDPGIASLLQAMVRAKWSGMVVGGPGAGKTTLLRAMLREVGPDEWPVTIESEPELHMPRVAPDVPWRAWYARHATAEGVGEQTLDDLVRAAKSHSPSRVVVGEILGAEVITMLDALTTGARGGWCTMHAKGVEEVFDRLHLYSVGAKDSWSVEQIYTLGSMALDVIVFLEPTPDRRRVISRIRHVAGYDADTRQPITSDWFVPGPDGSAVPNPDAPMTEHLPELERHGYRPDLHHMGNGVGRFPVGAAG